MLKTAQVTLGLSFVVLIGCWNNPKAPQTVSQQATANSQNRNGVSDPANSDMPVIQLWGSVVDLKKTIPVFETVFWEPRDTNSLRKLIRETDLVNDKHILEIGTGSGLISICCLAAGAKRAVANYVNPAAIANANPNARHLGFQDRFETRLVSLDDAGAYSVVGKTERFDLIISNPPWEDDHPKLMADYALYDPGFKLVESMLKDLKQQLTQGGKSYLAYGCVSTAKAIQQLGTTYDLKVRILDERSLDELDEIFLPGMMLEVTRNWPAENPGTDHG